MTNEEALKAWEKLYDEIDKENGLFVGTINPEMVSLAIKALEERPQGEWIYHDKLNAYFCKDCGLLVPFTKEEVEDGVRLPNFCHYCGAKMKID